MAKFPTAVISTVNGVRDWFPSHATTEKIPVMKAGIESTGHTDIEIIELPESMTRAQARDYLATNGIWNATSGDTTMSATVIKHPNQGQAMSAYDIMMGQAKGMRDRADVLTKQAQQAHELIKEAEKIEKAALPLAPKAEKPAPRKAAAKEAPRKAAPSKGKQVTAKQKASAAKTPARKQPTHPAPMMMQSGPQEPTRSRHVPDKEGADNNQTA